MDLPGAWTAVTRRARRSGLILLAAGLLTTGCATRSTDPSAPYFPTARPSPQPSAAVVAGGRLPQAAPVGNRGPVSRPNQQLTPGAVASRDQATVCRTVRASRPPVSNAVQATIFAEYHITPQQAHHYRLDYLVPLRIGGAAVPANLWPVATRGTGFLAKKKLNARLRSLVCHGVLPLTQAQQQVASDWYALWVKYAAG